jgi:hypothetical protein
VIPGSPTRLIEVDKDTELKVGIEGVGEVITLFQKSRSEQDAGVNVANAP